MKKHPAFLILSAALLSPSCQPPAERGSREAPPKILWAWERPEDLRAADPAEFGVAFLAQTLNLDDSRVAVIPRRQPLEVHPGAYLIAVTRIESSATGGRNPAYSDDQAARASELVKKTLELPSVRAIQVDFDARESERAFYRSLLLRLKDLLPANTPLSMTALASWCIGDTWISGLPVDEAVPMAFVMGADDRRVREHLAAGTDWREPLCRTSYGISVDEPLNVDLKPGRRVYYFKNRAWDRSDIEKIR